MPTDPDLLLRLRDWSLKRRMPGGEVTVLEGIDCDLRSGQWLAVLGTNGSGKSSLLRFLAGEESPLREPAAIMFQDPDEQIFAASVARELSLGRRAAQVTATLDAFGLAGLADRDPRLLSAGQKQRLVLAVALAAEPRVLFCDEPTSLQDSTQAAWVLDRLERWLRASGGALVTATCDRREAARADWLMVLHEGRIVCQGPTSELMEGPEVADLLGPADPPPPEPARIDPGPPTPSATPVLELEEIACRFPAPAAGIRGVDLRLYPGQRIGVTGPNGCGKSTLLAACAGARRPDAGVVRLLGRELYRQGARDLDHGAALLAPQFPEYLFTRSTVAEEIKLDPAFADTAPEEVLERVGLAAELARRNPHDLSSGQKRRLALGLTLGSGRPLLLLDEPTAALDRQGRRMVLAMLDHLDPVTAVVVASHDRAFLHRAGLPIFSLGEEGLWTEGKPVHGAGEDSGR